jgi:hypothetical protein
MSDKKEMRARIADLEEQCERLTSMLEQSRLPPNDVRNDLVHPDNDGFRECVTPKAIGKDVFVFRCGCGHAHFRHAGYLEVLYPLMRPGQKKRVEVGSHQVRLCVKCRHAYIWIDEQMYDVSDQIDVEAWRKSEVLAQHATGEGGQC